MMLSLWRWRKPVAAENLSMLMVMRRRRLCL